MCGECAGECRGRVAFNDLGIHAEEEEQGEVKKMAAGKTRLSGQVGCMECHLVLPYIVYF